MKISKKKTHLFIGLVIGIVALMTLNACSSNDESPSRDPVDDPSAALYQIPVVVHVLHNGEQIGESYNLSQQRIERQIEILNEDFRRKEGTRGFNNHPDGADARIEFVLAKQTPNGEVSNGIVRVDISEADNPYERSHSADYYSGYSYWDPTRYLNIWTTPLGDIPDCIVLGQSTHPDIEIPGSHLFTPISIAEGVIINALHFGESDIDCHARFGRTLTHEIGHFFGLLHPWGARHDCEHNDYVEDTPAVDDYVYGRDEYIGCGGEEVMIGNYMHYSHDEVMNIFTKGQVERMHYVIENTANRKSLTLSPALALPANAF